MIDLRNGNTDNSRIDNNINMDTINSNIANRSRISSLSPYLNYDPVYFPPSQPEFIFPEGGMKQRGRFELAFSQIGAACIIGGGIGGIRGFYKGLKVTTLEGQTGKLRRTQLINHVMKHGSALANTCGVVSVMYSGFGVILSYLRGTDDSLNTIAAATATGMFFKSTAGLKKCAVGGGIGFGISALFSLWNSRNSFSDIMHHGMNPA